MPAWLQAVLAALALPEYGLVGLFLICLLSASLLPLGSMPAVFALLKLNPDLFWPAMFVATAGNLAGGVINWFIGWGARSLADRYSRSRWHERALRMLKRLGPKACLFAWLPIVGDPLCAVAGWLRLPLGPCAAYMAVGMFTRYVVLSSGLVQLFPGRWLPQ